jgi:inner membrane protein
MWRLFRSPAFKLILIGILLLMLGIPLFMVWALTEERKGRADQVAAEVAESWGSYQSISGPVLVVPYTVKISSTLDGKPVETDELRRAVFLPERVDVTAKADTEVLRRSIFDVTVYGSEITIAGRFAAPDFAATIGAASSVRWNEAILAVAISDVSGLEQSAALAVNGDQGHAFEPSLGIPGYQLNGIHVPIGRLPAFAPAAGAVLAGPAAFDFATTLALKGSGQLDFAPVARETAVKIVSPWPHPSFFGAFAPLERSVSQSGFEASWRVPNLARSVPDAWTLTDGGFERLSPYQFGVRFYQPVDFYGMVVRALKYAFVFLAAAFLAVFLLELMSERRVHPVQYFFVGISMLFFYVLLLSTSEHIGFAPAYILSSIATGGMLSLYVGMSLASWRKGLILLVGFAVFYALLYLLLTLEDYALLAGAVGGFILLAATMFLTLKVDWSGGRKAS